MQYVHVHAHLCDTIVCADFVGLMLFTIKFNWTPRKISHCTEFMFMYLYMNKAWYLCATVITLAFIAYLVCVVSQHTLRRL